VAEVQPSRPRAHLALKSGPYFVQQRFPAEYREYQVTLPARDSVSLASVPYRSITYDRLVRKRGGGDGPRSVHGLFALMASRGEAIAGEGRTPHLQLGYTLDLPWFTVGGRLRGSTLGADPGNTGLFRRHSELGLAFTLQRFVDFEHFSMSFGLVAEGVLHRQSYANEARLAPTRTALGSSFGGLLALEKPLHGGLALHVEGGPVTLVYEQSVVEEGRVTGVELRTPFTYWAAAGVVWRL
jgi:hypothetical protein